MLKVNEIEDDTIHQNLDLEDKRYKITKLNHWNINIISSTS